MSKCPFCLAGDCIWHISPAQELQYIAREKLATVTGKRGGSVGRTQEGLRPTKPGRPVFALRGGVGMSGSLASEPTKEMGRRSGRVGADTARAGGAPATVSRGMAAERDALSIILWSVAFGWVFGLLTGAIFVSGVS